MVGDYDVKQWFAQIKGLEKEPEGGRRCRECFRLRLKTTAKIAKEKGLYDNFVTNGYMTKEALETIKPYLDAANVDLKFFKEG